VQDTPITANGYPLDESPEALGTFEPATDLLDDPVALRRRMEDTGHLFLPGLLDADLVEQARIEILQKYAILGEVDDRYPVTEARVGTGDAVPAVNMRAFSQSVRDGHWYRQVTDNLDLLAVFETLFDEPVHVYDMRWPRFVRPGEGCGFHCDGPYMNRGTDRVFTAWIPLGRVRLLEGSLLLLENSHRNERLRSGYLRGDADRDQFVWLDDDPRKVASTYGDRWLTADFAAGDVLCFSMQTLHGALDNQSPEGRCRLSSDSRYQPASEPRDERWNGSVIEGHGGSRVFYPGLGQWSNADFQDEWKRIDESGRIQLPAPQDAPP
jgi:hypothetical protein